MTVIQNEAIDACEYTTRPCLTSSCCIAVVPLDASQRLVFPWPSA